MTTSGFAQEDDTQHVSLAFVRRPHRLFLGDYFTLGVLWVGYGVLEN